MKFLLLFVSLIAAVAGHGRVWDPVNRHSAWRKGFKTPIDYDDVSDMCGYASYQNPTVPKSCKPCGVSNFPKTGPVVKTYKAGQVVTIDVDLTANHKGFMTFRLCPGTDVTEACFEQHRLKVLNSPNPQIRKYFDRYDWSDMKPIHKYVKVQLPADFKCEHCTLQWHWQTHNNWGPSNSEVWRQCSDMKIE